MSKSVSEDPNFLVWKFLNWKKNFWRHHESVNVGRHENGVVGNLEN